MASYNLMKKADRERMRADFQAELDATRDGTWPRDLNDKMRWVNAVGKIEDQRKYAGEMCQLTLSYLESVTRRLADNDPNLEGWER